MNVEILEAITEIVKNLGFPIVICVACFWFIKYMYDKNREDLQDQRNRYNIMLEEEKTSHKEEMLKMTEALNNNTVAITKLSTLLEKEDDPS